MIPPSKHKIHSKWSAYFLCCTFSTVRSQYATVFTSQCITLYPSCLFQKDERSLYGNIQSNILLFSRPLHRINLNVVPHITTPMPPIYSPLFFLILGTISINHILVVGLCLTCLESLQLQQQCTSCSCSWFFCSLKAVSLIWGNPL